MSATTWIRTQLFTPTAIHRRIGIYSASLPNGTISGKRSASRLGANKSFKPNLLRSSKSVAVKACHAFASTTQVGLTQALGAATGLEGSRE